MTDQPAPWPTPQTGRSLEPGTIGYVETYFGPVAGFGDRVLALLVDVAISLVALLPVLVSIPFFLAADSAERSGSGSEGLLVALGLGALLLGYLVALGVQLWNRVFRVGRRGQSIGKQVVGLRLVDARTGRPIGAGMCFAREIVSAVVNQVIYLSSLWMLWDDNRQTLADKVVTSTVIKAPKT